MNIQCPKCNCYPVGKVDPRIEYGRVKCDCGYNYAYNFNPNTNKIMYHDFYHKSSSFIRRTYHYHAGNC